MRRRKIPRGPSVKLPAEGSSSAAQPKHRQAKGPERRPPFLQFLALAVGAGLCGAVSSLLGKVALDLSPESAAVRLTKTVALRSGFSSDAAADLLWGSASTEGGLCVGQERHLRSLGFEIGGDLKDGAEEAAERDALWMLALRTTHSLCVFFNKRGEPDPCLEALARAALLEAAVRGAFLVGMISCGALMLQLHLKSLLASPSAAVASVCSFASNFLSSAALSSLVLGERLTFGFAVGACFMLSGVALLSWQGGDSEDSQTRLSPKELRSRGSLPPPSSRDLSKKKRGRQDGSLP